MENPKFELIKDHIGHSLEIQEFPNEICICCIDCHTILHYEFEREDGENGIFDVYSK